MTYGRSRAREIRRRRVRRKVRGSSDRPRFCVFLSNKHLYVQVIDDTEGKTLVSASSLGKELRGKLKDPDNKDAAVKVSKLAAKKCLDAGIKAVVFDRNGFLFHGRVKAMADAARETGLIF